MRQIHNTPHAPQEEDKLKKELTEAGLVAGNVYWLVQYLDPNVPEELSLLEKAVRQTPRSFTPQQALNFAMMLDRLLSHQNREMRYRAVKAFFSIFRTNLLQSSVTQARPWLNLQSKLSNMPLPLSQLIGPAAALALKAGYWNGGRDTGASIKAADVETIEKALAYSTDKTDIARAVLGCVWLWKQGGAKDGRFAEMTAMVQESAAALVDLTAPGIDVASRNLLAGYIRDGKDGPLPVKNSTLPSSAVNQYGYQYNRVNIHTNDAATVGSACFLAMEAAPELVPAFRTYAALCAGLTLKYSLDFAGEKAFQARIPWLIENTRFPDFLWMITYDHYQAFAVELAKRYPEQFELALKGHTYQNGQRLYKILETANPQRAAALHEHNRPGAQQRAAASVSQGFASSPTDEAALKKFILTGEGLEPLLKKYRITPANGYGYGGGNDAALYAQEYGLDSFLARCLIGQLFAGRSYQATNCWNEACRKLPNGQQHMGTVLEAMKQEGLPPVDCLVLSEWEWDHSYNSKDKQEVMDQTVNWMLQQDEALLPRVIEWSAAYSRSLAVYAYGKKGDYDAVLELASDGSKQVRSAVVDVFTARPYAEGPKAVKKLLQSKKAAQRETALNILTRLEGEAEKKGNFVQALREELEGALAKEKSLKLANTIRGFLGLEAAVQEGKPAKALGDPVAEVLKGGKKRKVQWVLDGTQQLASRMPGGALEAEDRLAAVMVCCMEPGGLAEAKKLAEPLEARELAAFAGAVFELWMDQNAPSKLKWVLTFSAVFGGREMVDVLKRQINQWPQASRGAIACEAVNALALSPEPEALMIVDSISRKFKFKQVKTAAGRALEYAAKELGLTSEELADRIVPDLGLDQQGQRVFNYGPRTFTVTLTPALELSVKNQDGKALKSLPAPGKTDDPELAPAASSEFKALKKQIKATVSTQTLRLEQALSTGRLWTGAGWRELFVKKPVMRQFAVGLIWGVYDGAGALKDTFRYLEDGSLNTADEEEYELSDEAQVGLVHPVELEAEAFAAWKQQMEDYEIKQPFLQLERPVARAEEPEARSLETFGGRVINGLTLTGKLLGQGWYRGSILDGGGFYDFYREDGPIGAQLNFEGASVGYEDGDTTIYDIQFYKSGAVSRGSYVYDVLGHGQDGKPVAKDERLLTLGQVPPRLFSEIVYQVQKATASSTETREDWKTRR